MYLMKYIKIVIVRRIFFMIFGLIGRVIIIKQVNDLSKKVKDEMIGCK